MRERPILMAGAMVRATMRDIDPKIQTRRPIKPQPWIDAQGNFCWKGSCYGQSPSREPHIQSIASPNPSSRTGKVLCPFGRPGDRLWVRETTIRVEEHGYAGPAFVESEDGRSIIDWGLAPGPDDVTEVEPHEIKLRPAIHMPRSMCRLVLEITQIRVERLQDISEEDARNEGAQSEFAPVWYSDRYGSLCGRQYRYGFAAIWAATYGEESWHENPFVWVLSFRRVTP